MIARKSQERGEGRGEYVVGAVMGDLAVVALISGRMWGEFVHSYGN
jgi:hypothetical protein